MEFACSRCSSVIAESARACASRLHINFRADFQASTPTAATSASQVHQDEARRSTSASRADFVSTRRLNATRVQLLDLFAAEQVRTW